MTSFLRKIFEKKVDDRVHRQFIRFGKGEFNGRFILNLWKAKRIKVKTSFELANDLVDLCSDFGNSKVSGIVLSKNDISNVMSQNKIRGSSERKKGGLYYENELEGQTLSKEQIMKISENSYFMLLDMENADFNLKMKKKLPKPGKAEDKIDDKFCQLEADEKFYSKIKDAFFWDVKEGKKVNVKHDISIKEIVMPKNETRPSLATLEKKNFAKIRELAKRKGSMIRRIEVDGKEEIKREVDLEA